MCPLISDKNCYYTVTDRRLTGSIHCQGEYECDFIVQRGAVIDALYQVCWDMSAPETRNREIRGLLEASRITGCKNLYVITSEHQEDIAFDNDITIHVLPAWRWLLNP